MVRTGWSASEMWGARAARLQLHRAIEQSKAARVLVAQRRFTIQSERLERRRQRLLQAAQHMSEDASQQHWEALTQRLLRYYHEAGELERAVAASVGA